MKYAKLIDGAIRFAPRKIKHGDSITYNPSADMLLERGYKPIHESEPPEAPEGYYYALSYTDEGEYISMVWTLTEEDPDAEEILNILTGESE